MPKTLRVTVAQDLVGQSQCRATQQDRKVRVLLVDDRAIIRQGLKALLAREPDFEVVGEARDGMDAVRDGRLLKPDLIVIELSMQRSDGADAIYAIKHRDPTVKVIVLTVHKEEQYIRTAFTAGADGYIAKADSAQELVYAMRAVLKGCYCLSPSITGEVIRRYLAGGETPRLLGPNSLTRRERSVVKLIAEGYKSREIAEYLAVSIKTVEKHRYNLMKKLAVSGVSELTAYAFKHGLVKTG